MRNPSLRLHNWDQWRNCGAGFSRLFVQLKCCDSWTQSPSWKVCEATPLWEYVCSWLAEGVIHQGLGSSQTSWTGRPLWCTNPWQPQRVTHSKRSRKGYAFLALCLEILLLQIQTNISILTSGALWVWRNLVWLCWNSILNTLAAINIFGSIQPWTATDSWICILNIHCWAP